MSCVKCSNGYLIQTSRALRSRMQAHKDWLTGKFSQHEFCATLAVMNEYFNTRFKIKTFCEVLFNLFTLKQETKHCDVHSSTSQMSRGHYSNGFDYARYEIRNITNFWRKLPTFNQSECHCKCVGSVAFRCFRFTNRLKDFIVCLENLRSKNRMHLFVVMNPEKFRN